MGLTVYGGGGKPEEEKTVTAGTSVIVVNPSSGKVMKKITVNPTPSQSKTVTPSTSQQTVSPDSGKLLSKVIVKAMEDVTPEVTAQTPVITQIAENLGVTITTPSGTNKQILQGNNANLLNIKNNAKKEGAYAWKKWKIESKQVTLSFSVLNNSNPYQLKVDCDNEIALKIATASSFVGLHGIWNGTGYYEFPDANTLRIYDGTNVYNFASVYDASTNIFSVTSASGIGTTEMFADCSHTMQAGTFEGFTVSDNSTAYPDGGEQGGYWYEKFQLDPTLFGCTKYAVDKFTFSSPIASDQAVLNHSLGRVPRIAVLVPDANISGTLKFHTGVAVFLNGGLSGSMGYIVLGVSGSESTFSSVSLTANNTTIKLRSNSGYYFATGVEYALITMA